MDLIKIANSPINVGEVYNSAVDPSCGAVSLFVGTTRDHFNNQKVIRLEYEAYQEMAYKELQKICKNAREKWDLHHIAIQHRLGVVNVAEASVVIAVSSVHRKESLDAVPFIIDSLKASVPIWKLEVYEDQTTSWKQNEECAWKKTK